MADLYSKSLHEYFTLQLLRLWTHPSGPLLCNVISGLQQNKKLAFALLILCFSQLCCWLLNGTLYLRPKALIPFLPLFLLLTARTLSLLQQKS